MKFLGIIKSLFTKPPKSNITLMYSILHDNYTSKEQTGVDLIAINLEGNLDSTVNNTKLTAHLSHMSDMNPISIVDALLEPGEETINMFYLKIEEGIRITELVPKYSMSNKYVYILDLENFIVMLDTIRSGNHDKFKYCLSTSVIVSLDYTWDNIAKELKEGKFNLTSVKNTPLKKRI